MPRATERTLSPRSTRTRPRTDAVLPLYHQIYLHLRDQITAGTYPPDEPLPSEPTLAERFAVSRVTIRNTLARLEQEGLVRRVRGVGTFAVRPAAIEPKTNISGQLESLISFEGRTTVDNLSHAMVALPEPLRETFGDREALRVVRVRRYLDEPMSFTTLHVPLRYAQLINWPPVTNEPLIMTLEAAGVVPDRAEQSITAVAASARVAKLLRVAKGTPLIAMRRLMLDAERRPVLHQESLYVPERFEYRMTLRRTDVGPVAKWTPIG